MGGEIFLAEKRKRPGNKSNVEPEATICMCPSPPLPLPHHSNVSLTLSLSPPLTKNLFFVVQIDCSFVHQGIQLCGIYYSCVKPTNPEVCELKKIFDGVCTKVRVFACCKTNNIKVFIVETWCSTL